MKGIFSAVFLAGLSSVSAQAVTAIISAPGSAPSGCALSESGVFGIQVVKAAAGAAKRQVTQIGDGQVQASSAKPVTQIGDGQIQASTAVPARPVTQISDGQIQASTAVPARPVTQIGDGQVQAATAVPVTQIGDGQVQAATGTPARPVTAIADGQIQAPAGPVTVTVTKNNCVASPVTQIGDGQVQAPMATPITAIADGQIQAPVSVGTPVTAIADGQVQAPKATPVTAIADGQPQAGTTLATSVRSAGMATGTTAAGYAMLAGAPQACASVTGILKLSLSNGVLKDAQGRTGYIASNSQFQFDGPPQAGAIYTAGFSVCSSGYLALGSTTTFYQCLSGGFYNLYLNNVLSAGQCEAIKIQVVQINSC